jgi:hypothetical protein
MFPPVGKERPPGQLSMDWDSFSASLDAGATLADFFPPDVDGGGSAAAGSTSSARSSASSGGGGGSGGSRGSEAVAGATLTHTAASPASATSRLYEAILSESDVGGGRAGRMTTLFYQRLDCCAYGLGTTVPPSFKDRAPMFIHPGVEGLGLSSFNWIDLHAVCGPDDESSGEGEGYVGARCGGGAGAAGEAADECIGGHVSAAAALGPDRPLAHKLRLLLDNHIAPAPVRLQWLQQQQRAFVGYSVSEWTSAIGSVVAVCIARDGGGPIGNPGSGRSSGAQSESSQPLSLDLDDLRLVLDGVPAADVAAAFFNAVHLLSACVIFGRVRDVARTGA